MNGRGHGLRCPLFRFQGLRHDPNSTDFWAQTLLTLSQSQETNPTEEEEDRKGKHTLWKKELGIEYLI